MTEPATEPQGINSTAVDINHLQSFKPAASPEAAVLGQPQDCDLPDGFEAANVDNKEVVINGHAQEAADTADMQTDRQATTEEAIGQLQDCDMPDANEAAKAVSRNEQAGSAACVPIPSTDTVSHSGAPEMQLDALDSTDAPKQTAALEIGRASQLELTNSCIIIPDSEDNNTPQAVLLQQDAVCRSQDAPIANTIELQQDPDSSQAEQHQHEETPQTEQHLESGSQHERKKQLRIDQSLHQASGSQHEREHVLQLSQHQNNDNQVDDKSQPEPLSMPADQHQEQSGSLGESENRLQPTQHQGNDSQQYGKFLPEPLSMPASSGVPPGVDGQPPVEVDASELRGTTQGEIAAGSAHQQRQLQETANRRDAVKTGHAAVEHAMDINIAGELVIFASIVSIHCMSLINKQAGKSCSDSCAI